MGFFLLGIWFLGYRPLSSVEGGKNFLAGWVSFSDTTLLLFFLVSFSLRVTTIYVDVSERAWGEKQSNLPKHTLPYPLASLTVVINLFLFFYLRFFLLLEVLPPHDLLSF